MLQCDRAIIQLLGRSTWHRSYDQNWEDGRCVGRTLFRTTALSTVIFRKNLGVRGSGCFVSAILAEDTCPLKIADSLCTYKHYPSDGCPREKARACRPIAKILSTLLHPIQAGEIECTWHAYTASLQGVQPVGSLDHDRNVVSK